MLKDISESPLYKIANPKSIVVFGASSDPTSMGTIQLSVLMDLGFKGKIYPVHLRDRIIMGLKAYKDVMEIPEVPDLALIVVPTKVVAEILRSCGEKGIRSAIVVSAGFKEMGEEGRRMEQELVDIAKRYGIRFLGPNCIGVANPHERLNTTFFKYGAKPGFIGMASQSGSFVTQMFEYLNLFGMGFSTAFSVGNEANIDIVDCLEYLSLCPNTRVITLYIEGVKRGKEFVEVAKEVSLKKPVVAYYVGGTKTGKKAGMGHTGAVAGPDVLYDGAFKQAGVIRANSIMELFQIAWGFGTLPIPQGNRVVVQTHSGGPGAAAADAVGRVGLEMPDLSPHLVTRLKEYLPSTANVKNPVDLTFSKNLMAYYNELPKLLLEAEETDILYFYALLPQERLRNLLRSMGVEEEERLMEMAREAMDGQAKFLRGLMDGLQKPIVCFNYRDLCDPYVSCLIENHVPVFMDPVMGARVIRAMADYKAWKENRMRALENQKGGEKDEK